MHWMEEWSKKGTEEKGRPNHELPSFEIRKSLCRRGIHMKQWGRKPLECPQSLGGAAAISASTHNNSIQQQQHTMLACRLTS